jgi:hypothetical protein
MLSVKAEQCVNVKFLTKLGKSATERYSLLMQVNGDECLLILKFSSGSKDIKKEGERLKTISVPVKLAHQKQVLTLKKPVKFSEKVVA